METEKTSSAKGAQQQYIALLARLDERTISIQNDLGLIRGELHSIQDGVDARILEIEKRVELKLQELEDSLDEKYVKAESFGPVQKLVYGFVGVVVLGVIGAMVSSVIKP